MPKDYANRITTVNSRYRKTKRLSLRLIISLLSIIFLLGLVYLFYRHHILEQHQTKVTKILKKEVVEQSQIVEPHFDFYTILPKLKLRPTVETVK
jgi:hypothetical protein